MYNAGLVYVSREQRSEARAMMESASERGYLEATSWISEDDAEREKKEMRRKEMERLKKKDGEDSKKPYGGVVSY